MQLLGDARRTSDRERQYTRTFRSALTVIATPRRHPNVLQHTAGTSKTSVVEGAVENVYSRAISITDRLGDDCTRHIKSQLRGSMAQILAADIRVYPIITKPLRLNGGIVLGTRREGADREVWLLLEPPSEEFTLLTHPDSKILNLRLWKSGHVVALNGISLRFQT